MQAVPSSDSLMVQLIFWLKQLTLKPIKTWELGTMATFWANSNVRCWIVSFLVVVLTGCGGGAPMAQISGTIKSKDGVPVERGMLLLTPVPSEGDSKPGKGAVGRVGNGAFDLSTNGQGDGVSLGRHNVRLTQASMTGTGLGCELSAEFKEVEISEGDTKLELIVVVNERVAPRDNDDDDD